MFQLGLGMRGDGSVTLNRPGILKETVMKRESSARNAAFPSRLILDQIADKWPILILAALMPDPLQFNALKRELNGVTQEALTEALRRLQCNRICCA